MPSDFARSISHERLREAALNGEIVNLLNWMTVEAGDAFFIPAGTVHAIGQGLAICEIQQHSDITYRLYDYGRPASCIWRRPCRLLPPRPATSNRVMLPIDCQYFHTELARIAIAHLNTFRQPIDFTF